ncbi:MAG TPA: FAD/NAD(P)-binding oxidoreductase [Afifellaceae bacterium]|nr:FAD/NAD(P)-binding oxidoreductase [Afifellaceae bacterium]
MAGPVVIAGAGQAGLQVAVSLRQLGFDGEITLVGDEPGLPYQRPPLSKAYLKDGAAERLVLRNADFFADNRIELLNENRVDAIDRQARAVTLGSGSAIGYDHLVLALGARNRQLPLDGAGLENVVELRTLAHAADIRERLGSISHAVVIGGGFIGLEFAAVARGLGKAVTVLEATPRVMGRVVSEPVSAYFAEFHRAAGVALETGAMAAGLTDDGQGRVAGVRLADGRTVDCDMVLVAAGIVPNVEPAAAAGLDVDNGIVVDERLQTGDPAVSAIGDCAAFPDPASGERIRLESVQNATDQAKFVAARLTGADGVYDAVPWFWSDQGDRKLQIAGLTGPADDRVSIDGGDGRLSVHCFRDGTFIGCETVNVPADHMMARRMLGTAGRFTRTELDEAGFDLKAFRDKVAGAKDQ